ncbi:MAG TPA: oligoendopeptidase F [candidate division Zixibacteria bacterium]|nr:oligoendopeptidase F [candidate division Zixibacteria bacterium]
MKKQQSLIMSILAALMLFGLMAGVVAAQDQDATTIPKREDIDDKYKWRLEDIYEDSAAWYADYNLLEASLTAFDPYRGHLGDSPETLYNCLHMSDSLDMILGRLYVYAYMKLDENTQESMYQSMSGEVAGLNSRISEQQAFISPEIISLGEAKVMGMIDAYEPLGVYRHHFEDQFRQQAHILSDKEEAILAAASPVLRAPSDIFNMIDNADHKMGRIVTTDGDTIELTNSRYYDVMREADRETRRIANDSVQTSWKKYLNTLAMTFGGSLKADWFQARVRGYNSCLESSLDGYNVPTAVFTNLIEATNANLESCYKWYALRKKFLKLDTMYTYDLSVSMAEASNRRIPYEEAIEMVTKGLKPLGKQYVKDLQAGFSSGWIDVYETENKGSGAYNWGTYTTHPYVLLNYGYKIDDVFTLAHELGHAMHSFYTNRNETYQNSGHSLFLAEVASTCNEAILMKYLLENTKDKDEKLALLYYYIKQIDGTFFSQVMFSEFEQAVHQHVEEGGAFSADYFRETYREIFQKYMGPDVVIGPDNDMGGLKISHFYREFYVYQYATAYAAAQMISQKIMEGDKQALEAYHEFLATGTSDYPLEILKKAGVDLTQPEAVKRTLDLFGELVDEMEKLLMEG